MNSLGHTRRGAGEPLILLHALGSSRRVWSPVLPALAERFDVVAVDLPGFGESEVLPADVEPSPLNLARAVGRFLDEQGIVRPHVVGNSIGGWIGLELAAIRPVSSLTLLAPAGLWSEATPRYCRVSLGMTRWAAEHATRPLCWAVRSRVGRALVLGQTHGRPGRVSVAEAQEAVRSLGTCPGFASTFGATLHRGYRATQPIEVPVTVAFGSRDLVLPRRTARRLDQLPSDCHMVTLPGCGHLPMSDDPEAVARLITESASVSRGLAA